MHDTWCCGFGSALIWSAGSGFGSRNADPDPMRVKRPTNVEKKLGNFMLSALKASHVAWTSFMEAYRYVNKLLVLKKNSDFFQL